MSNSIVNRTILYKIIHLVPYDTIGGVESAARTMGSLQQGEIDFKVEYIYTKNPRIKGINIFYNILFLLSSAFRIIRKSPDVLIVSLWRSSIVAILVKLFHPKIKLVTFIHFGKDVHYMDYIFTKISLWLSLQIWSDSQATIVGRLSASQCKRAKVISFVTKDLESFPQKNVEPIFIFWGRIHSQKGLDRSVRIFSEIVKCYSCARFYIFGPDGGALSDIKKLCMSLDLVEPVTFMGPATFDQIASYARLASFYLQTSVMEGMAMSVIEAMQLGLVPVVTPVGEIASYGKDGRNAVIVESDDKAVKDILSLLGSNERYQVLRTAAIQTWNGKPLYKESVLDACHNLIESELSLKDTAR
jgi:glycosyltransferase involved in cell wall biosynthesis